MRVLYRASALAVLVLLAGCGIRYPASYALPKSKNVSIASCYVEFHKHAWFSGDRPKPKSYFSKEDQRKINAVYIGLPKALEDAGYIVKKRNGCNEAKSIDDSSVNISLLYRVWVHNSTDPDGIEVYASFIDSNTRKPVPILDKFYGSPQWGDPPAKEVVPKIQSALIKAIKVGQHNSMMMEKAQDPNAMH